ELSSRNQPGPRGQGGNCSPLLFHGRGAVIIGPGVLVFPNACRVLWLGLAPAHGELVAIAKLPGNEIHWLHDGGTHGVFRVKLHQGRRTSRSRLVFPEYIESTAQNRGMREKRVEEMVGVQERVRFPRP